MHQTANLEESEIFLYDYVYDSKSDKDYANKSNAYNKLYSKNINPDEQLVNTEFIPHKPLNEKPNFTKPYKAQRTLKAGRKKNRKYRK